MTKEESVQKFKDASDALIGQVFDDGLASAPVQSGGGFSQSDVDAAVQAAKDADAKALADVQASDAQAMSDAVAAVQVQLDASNKSLAEAQAGKAADDVIIDGLKNGQQAIQDALDKLKALISG